MLWVIAVCLSSLEWFSALTWLLTWNYHRMINAIYIYAAFSWIGLNILSLLIVWVILLKNCRYLRGRKAWCYIFLQGWRFYKGRHRKDESPDCFHKVKTFELSSYHSFKRKRKWWALLSLLIVLFCDIRWLQGCNEN